MDAFEGQKILLQGDVHTNELKYNRYCEQLGYLSEHTPLFPYNIFFQKKELK